MLEWIFFKMMSICIEICESVYECRWQRWLHFIIRILEKKTKFFVFYDIWWKIILIIFIIIIIIISGVFIINCLI